MIIAKINVEKIENERIVQGKKGKYLDLVLMENRDGTDQYGNDGFVCHSVTKEERLKGVKGTIVGNFKRMGSSSSRPAPTSAPPPEVDNSDVPFK